MAEKYVIVELHRSSTDWARVVDEIVRIEKKVFPKHESLARSFDDELKKRNAGLLYAHAEGEVFGYVMYSWPTSLSASITKLAVKENHRRKGVGDSLLKEAISKCRCRKVQRVCLHVDPCRNPAMALYMKCGFQIDELIESYYSQGRDAYRMYLEFETGD